MPQFFNAAVMTNAGAALLARSIAEGVTIDFLSVAVGNGSYTNAEKAVEALKQRTALKSFQVGYTPQSVIREDNSSVRISALLSNFDPDTHEAIVESGFYINEIGIMAQPSDEATDPILFSIAVTSATQGDYMPAYTGDNPAQIVQGYVTAVSNDATISIIDPVNPYALATDFQELADTLDARMTQFEEEVTADIDERIESKLTKGAKTTVTEPFRTRQISELSNGVGSIRKIYGNSEVTKNLIPYPYANGTSRTHNGITFTVNSDRSITMNGTATGTATFYLKIQATPKILRDGSAIASKTFNVSGLSLVVKTLLDEVQVQRISNEVGDLTATVDEHDSEEIYLRVESGATVNNVRVYPQIEYGSTATDYEPYFSGIRSFLSSGIKVTGKNLADLSDGKLTTANCTYSRIPNGLRTVATSASYPYIDIKIPDYFAGYRVVYSITPTVVSGNAEPHIFFGCVVNGVTRYLSSNTDIPVNATDIVLRLIIKNAADCEVGSTVDFTNIQLEIGSTATSYEPYHENILPLPITEVADGIFSDGMKSAGSVRDELTRDMAVKRIGAVDLGTLTYTRGDMGFTSNQVLSRSGASFISTLYSYNSRIWADPHDGDAAFGSDGRILLINNNYSDATAFKTAMNGVMLYYELATPVTSPINPPLLLTYEAEANGTETLVVPAGEESSLMVADTDYVARDEAINLSVGNALVLQQMTAKVAGSMPADYDANGTLYPPMSLCYHDGQLKQNTTDTTVSGAWVEAYWEDARIDLGAVMPIRIVGSY